MFIVHVVTAVSEDGAYGGPVSVALNQMAELQARGHRCLLLASDRESSSASVRMIEGVEVRTFPVLTLPGRPRFAGLLSPDLLRCLYLVAKQADVVHLHLSRDLIMLTAGILCRFLGVRYVLQTHGMVIPQSRRVIRIVDALLTRRIIVRTAAVLVLTPQENDQVVSLFGARIPRLVRLQNGVRPLAEKSSEPTQIKFLFLSRLHARKNPALFIEASLRRLEDGSDALFDLAGPDEGELASCMALIRKAGHPSGVRYIGAFPNQATARLLRECSVLVLPSINEPFPMVVLEAMSASIPVIVTKSNGLAEAIEISQSGLVVEPTVDALTRAMRVLETNNQGRMIRGQRARALVEDKFSIDSVVDRLLDVYIV